MKVQIFDCDNEDELQEKINSFLDDEIEVLDIKYQVSSSIFGEEQIYCFSALILYTN